MTTTNALSRPDLLDPVFTIQHVAALFHVSVDTAREYTYRGDFPAARLLGARNLWDREEILAWFRALPPRAKADRTEGPVDAVVTDPATDVKAKGPKPYKRRGDASGTARAAA